MAYLSSHAVQCHDHSCMHVHVHVAYKGISSILPFLYLFNYSGVTSKILMTQNLPHITFFSSEFPLCTLERRSLILWFVWHTYVNTMHNTFQIDDLQAHCNHLLSMTHDSTFRILSPSQCCTSNKVANNIYGCLTIFSSIFPHCWITYFHYCHFLRSAALWVFMGLYAVDSIHSLSGTVLMITNTW